MATHSSVLAWRIPWTEESGGLQSMRSQELYMTYLPTYGPAMYMKDCAAAAGYRGLSYAPRWGMGGAAREGSPDFEGCLLWSPLIF